MDILQIVYLSLFSLIVIALFTTLGIWTIRAINKDVKPIEKNNGDERNAC
jgi:hypothetical protein